MGGWVGEGTFEDGGEGGGGFELGLQRVVEGVEGVDLLLGLGEEKGEFFQGPRRGGWVGGWVGAAWEGRRRLWFE